MGLDVDGKRGTTGTEAQEGGRKRPGEVDKVLLVDSHVEWSRVVSGWWFGSGDGRLSGMSGRWTPGQGKGKIDGQLWSRLWGEETREVCL